MLVHRSETSTIRIINIPTIRVSEQVSSNIQRRAFFFSSRDLGEKEEGELE